MINVLSRTSTVCKLPWLIQNAWILIGFLTCVFLVNILLIQGTALTLHRNNLTILTAAHKHWTVCHQKPALVRAMQPGSIGFPSLMISFDLVDDALKMQQANTTHEATLNPLNANPKP